MFHYVYHPDANHFNGVGLAPEDRDVTKVRTIDSPVHDRWAPIVVHGFPENPGEDGDFPSLADYNQLPIMSKRAWDILRPLVGYCCEPLPIIYPSGDPFFIIHVMETIDCLDPERSQVKRFSDGRIMRVFRYSFRQDMLVGKRIFKLPRQSAGELIVDDHFRAAVETNGLRGLIFKPVRTVE